MASRIRHSKLCHFGYHEFDDKGLCLECENTKKEIIALYRFYYPTFDAAAALSGADSVDAAGDY